jgi:hypothetical protein
VTAHSEPATELFARSQFAISTETQYFRQTNQTNLSALPPTLFTTQQATSHKFNKSQIENDISKENIMSSNSQHEFNSRDYPQQAEHQINNFIA